MNNMTDYQKDKLLKNSLITQKVYCGLLDVTEVKGASYKRVEVSFSEPAQGVIMNKEDVLFAIAQEDWGEIKKIALYDAETEGNALWVCSAETIKSVTKASQYKIPKNYMIIRLL